MDVIGCLKKGQHDAPLRGLYNHTTGIGTHSFYNRISSGENAEDFMQPELLTTIQYLYQVSIAAGRIEASWTEESTSCLNSCPLSLKLVSY